MHTFQDYKLDMEIWSAAATATELALSAVSATEMLNARTFFCFLIRSSARVTAIDFQYDESIKIREKSLISLYF